MVVPFAMASMMVLGATSMAYSNSIDSDEKEIYHIESRTDVHHLNNKSISGRGYENVYVNIGCPDDKDTHNRAKIHFYNRSSEPVTVRAEGQAITVQPWSGNSFNLNVSHGSLPITIRGLNDNSNQVLNGELSVKSWAE
nr:hypothetical protein [uncultured Tyzzerella sp.]